MIASPDSRMHVLLLRPVPGNDRFGLGPFFRIEPLGLEYIAAALESARASRNRRRPAIQPIGRSPPASHASGDRRHRLHARPGDRRGPGAGGPGATGQSRFVHSRRRPLGGRVSVAVLHEQRRRDLRGRWRARRARPGRRAGSTAPSIGGRGAAAAQARRTSSTRTRGIGRARSRSDDVPAPLAPRRRRLASPVRLPAVPACLADRNRARVSVPLLVLFGLARCTTAPSGSARSRACATTSRRRAPPCSSPTICSGISRRAVSSSPRR